MKNTQTKRQIGIIGGGPSGLFLFKKLVEADDNNMEVFIFEKKDQLGSGMPYSKDGASFEHITNVSDNEIPEIVTSIDDWIGHAPDKLLNQFEITPASFNEYKVVPRLLFGEYLSYQFDLLLEKAKTKGLDTHVFTSTVVTDIMDFADQEKVSVYTKDEKQFIFDAVVISTGHYWPRKFEDKIKNWFDSPYPPVKLEKITDYPVAIKGSSLTAIDAVRTLARQNGHFQKYEDNTYRYILGKQSPNFKLVMHSLDGLLPAIRFHLEDSHLSKDSLISIEEVKASKKENGGFIPLDYIFERNFKQPLQKERPAFYEKIKNLSIEEFVEMMMSHRENRDAFELFRAEYIEAEKSIEQRQSVYWKEMLAVLSYSMNYPAKHLSAEDMLRLRKVLMPLISIVIAFVPQSSCREILALYDAGILSLVPVDKDSKAEPADGGGAIYTYTNEAGQKIVQQYEMFIDAVGQPAFMPEDFLFKGLLNNGSVSAALLAFKDQQEGARQNESGNKDVIKNRQGDFFLKVPGIAINDHFQAIDNQGKSNKRIYVMAVPYIGGLNPDYSGLDFCDEASERIVKAFLKTDH